MKKLLMILACLMAVNTLKADSVDWLALTKNAEYPKRYNVQIETKNNLFYLIDGGIEGSSPTKDVWFSANGVEWTALTRNAEFNERLNLSTALYNDNFMVFGGSNSGTYYNDVWTSSDGIEWESLTLNAEWEGRELHSSIVFDGKIFIIGGYDGTNHYNDVWTSTNGIEWIAITKNAEFEGRKNFGNTICDNKMWIVGGGGDGTSYKDVWTSINGVEWTALTKNAEFGTAPGSRLITFCFDETFPLYVHKQTTGKIWKSNDGILWTELTTAGETIGTKSGQGNGFIINGHYVYIAGYYLGNDTKEVWMGTIIEETATITPSFTALPTVETETPSITPTSTATTTKTVTKTITATHSITKTITATRTVSPTWTSSNTNTPTITATPTRTNTLLTTPTVTVTVTPILTLEPILRYVSTDYDNHKTTLRLEWTKYDDNALQYYLTVYDRTYKHESTTILSNSADISPDLEWLTHDLIGLRYDYCYNIGLTITSSNWSEPVYADTIVICPFESPTPFAGTPTASNTPDCSPPTATPTPQVTIVQTVTGKYIFDDFSSYPFGTTITADNSDWDVVSANAVAQATAVGTPGYDWVTTIQDGYTAVKVPYNCSHEWHSGLGMWLNLKDEDEVYYQARVRKGITNNQLIAGSTAVTPAANLTLWVWDYIHNYVTWGHTFYGFGTGNSKNQNQLWTDVYTYQSVTKGSEHLLVDVATNSRIMHADTMYNNLGGDYFGTDTMLWKIAPDSRATENIWLTNLLIAKNKWVTIHGVSIGDKVQLLTNADVITDTLVADTTYVKFNMVGTITPTQRKIRVTNTNGWVYTSTLLTVCAGDQWVYNLVP